jgi:hypothetical protein
MRLNFALFFIFVTLTTSGRAAQPDGVPHLDTNDPVALQEAIRLLDAEVKLAARPQPYVVIDLVDSAIRIKGRGVELHRLPLEHWTAFNLAEVTAGLKLQARPSVTRRKIDPADSSDQPPVSLDDMPAAFTLHFSPPLTVTISSAHAPLWQWVMYKGLEWWTRLRNWGAALATGTPPRTTPTLHLILSPDHARSLAWSVTDGMPFLIRRPSSP